MPNFNSTLHYNVIDPPIKGSFPLGAGEFQEAPHNGKKGGSGYKNRAGGSVLEMLGNLLVPAPEK